MICRVLALFGLLAAAMPVGARTRADSWRGQWVWLKGRQSERNFYLYARRTFEFDAVPKKALARITADSRYKLWVNGRFVGRGPARSDPAWWYYDRFDLAPFLRVGANVIAVLVNHYGDGTFQYIPAPAGLLFEAQIGNQLIVSDSSWKVRRADAYRQDLPKIDLQLPAMEEFDARKEPLGWNRADFDDSAWDSAALLGPVGFPPHVNLIPRDIPHLRERLILPARLLGAYEIDLPGTAGFLEKPPWIRMGQETLLPLKDYQLAAEPGLRNILLTTGRRPHTLVLDMGREMIGFPRIKVTAPAGTIIDLGYSELLENGRVNPNRADVHYADRYVCREGQQEFELFTQRAFRYLQVDVRAPRPGESVAFQLIGQNYAVYPVEYRGEFECSDKLLNDIWKLGRYTVEQCMEDGYTDCPWRERGQWWGDARAEAFTTYYAFGDARLIRKAILQIAQGQYPDGITPGVWPADFDGRRLPDFCLIWIMTLDDYTRFTGDLSLARELYPKVVRALKWFDQFKDKDGLLRNVPHWVFIDWADIDKSGSNTALNAYYVGALKAAVDLHMRLYPVNPESEVRFPAQVRQWLISWNVQRQLMNLRMWSESEGAYVDAIHNDGKQSSVISEQANALCILFGIADSKKAARIFDRFSESRSTLNSQLSTKIVRCGSPYFSFYWLWAMHESGRHQQAVDYTRNHWKVMLDAGATTAWEVWNPSASLCHGWSSGPTNLLPGWILGVRPAADGFKRIRIAPQTAGLSWARGVVPTPRGAVKVDWQRIGSTREGPQMILIAETPKGTQTEIVIPGQPPALRINGRWLTKLHRESDGVHLIHRGGRIRIEAY